MSIKRLLLLFRLNWKSGNGMDTFTSSSGSTSRKRLFGRGERQSGDRPVWQTALIYLGSFGYLFWMISNMVAGMTENLVAIGRPELFHPLFLAGLSLMIFIFGFMSTTAIYFFSRDRERIMCFPFRTTEVMGARYLVLVFYQALTAFGFGVPAWFTFGWKTHQSFGFYLKALVLLFLLNWAVTAVVSALTLILNRLIPLAKNKDRFMMITNIVMIVGVLAFVMLMNTKGGNTVFDNPALLLSGAGRNYINTVSYLVPVVPFLVRMMQESGIQSWLMGGAAFGITLALTVLALMVAHLTYETILGQVGTGGATGRRLKKTEIQKNLRQSSQFLALIRKEKNMTFRSPAIFVNNVLGTMIMPVLMVVFGVIGFVKAAREGGEQMSFLEVIQALSRSLTQLPPSESHIWLILGDLILGTAILIFFFQAGVLLNATALSREGSSAYWIKMIPISYSSQFWAKTVLSLLIGITPTLFLGLILLIVTRPPLLLWVGFFLSLLLSSLLTNFFSLMLDAWSPRLKWDNEQQIVKSSKNVFFSMMLQYALAALMGLFIYFSIKHQWNSLLFPVASLIALGFVTWLIARVAWKTLHRTLDHLERYD